MTTADWVGLILIVVGLLGLLVVFLVSPGYPPEPNSLESEIR